MNDTLYEQLIAQKSKISTHFIRLGILLAAIATVFLSFPLLGPFSIAPGIIIMTAAVYLIFPRLKIEYEYILLNHDMQIDIIYNKSSRKSLCSFDLQKAEIIAPKGSPHLRSFHTDKTYTYTSGRKDSNIYAIILPLNNKTCCIYFEPDTKMLSSIKSWVGSRFYTS